MKDRKSAKILIVDDNPANLSVLSECLESYEFEILIAQNGESAIQKANYANPDLIILDIMMPGIDGFETCKRLKEKPKTQNIPIILMTALSDHNNKVKGLKSGAVDYITKPFQQDEVVARINIHLSIHYLSQEVQEKNLKLQKEIEEHKLSENRLRGTLEELAKTQVKLVQSEKIAGIGRVVAGLCHEFNNPISFITGNIQFLRKYVEDLVNIINLDKDDNSSQELISLSHKRDIISHEEMEYIINDIPKVIASIEAGTDRIIKILDRLKKFSFLDQSGKKMLDINDGLEGVISLISHRIEPVTLETSTGSINRPKIKVIREYDRLPLVYCYPDQIHQALLNLVTNSVDAIDEIYESSTDSSFVSEVEPANNSYQGPLLTLKTKYHPTHISIHIIDNGVGIPDNIQSHIFDPFFTTKAVGKGVGLGLAICFQIMTEMHHGCLTCKSNSLGTEMIIELPLEPDD